MHLKSLVKDGYGQPSRMRKAKLFSAKEAILERRKKKKKQNRSSKELDLTEGVIFFFYRQ